jgi:hypothetical protein
MTPFDEIQEELDAITAQLKAINDTQLPALLRDTQELERRMDALYEEFRRNPRFGA